MADLQEDETHELKEQWNSRALDDLAALANCRGGTLFVGVADDGQVIGIERDDAEAQRIASQIVDHLGISPSVEWREIDGAPVLAIEVTPPNRLVACRGRYLTRVGSTNRDLTPEQMGRLLLKRTGQTWDGLATEQGLDAIDPDLLGRFVGLAQERLPQLRVTDSPEQILRNLSLLRDDRLTTAAVLLFTRSPQALYPQSRVRIGRFKGIEILDSHDYEGSLWDQLDGAMSKFRDLLEVRFEIKVEEPTLEGLQRRDIWEYPLEALREALVNALIHRDYTISADIQVRVYDDQLAIWSPGSLPEGIRLEQLREPGHPSVLRNPSIAQVLYYAGVIERWGTGTTRIIGWCTDQGLPEPAFEEDGDWFRTTFAADPYVPERLAAMGLSERQVRAVLYVKERGSISNQEYQELAGLKKRQSSDDLRFLADAGILERVGTTGRGTHYALKGRQRGERGAKGAPKGQSWPQSGIEGPTPGSESP